MNDKLLSAVKASAKGYGSVPFWSWNDRLEPEELRRQIRAMDSIGMNGFFMHARGGLETEYLSEEWFDCIAACVDEAKKLGMDAWSYDENGWPSGFAGGLLLTDEDNHARYMVSSVEDSYPAGDDVLAVYTIADGKCARADENAPAPYYVIRERADSSYVDVLRKDITEKFIAATHEEYKKRLGEDFGGAMPGFFTDEPQYYRYAAPYSRKLAEEFSARFGYDLFDALAAVFWDYDGCIAHRYDYFLLIHELYMKHFAKPIYDWCEANGCQLTGHGIEESSLAGQMMVITEELGLDLKDADVSQLGRARQIKISKENTIIVDGAGNADEIASRVAQIKSQIEATNSDFDREKLQERLAKLAGGVAVIRVGAATETEMREMKLRIEDALAATKAAIEEGYVAGGGVALLNAIPALDEYILSLTDADEKTGAKIVRKAIEEPVRQIAANAGLEGSVIIDGILRSGKQGYGFNFASEEYTDMTEAGILDPTKVTRSALQNASSVAAMVLTTESLVTDKPDPAADAAASAAAMAAAQGGGMY